MQCSQSSDSFNGSKKPLLIFAHPGEARCFIPECSSLTALPLPEMKLKPLENSKLILKESPRFFLLITGEGRQNATLATSFTLALLQNKISSVINYGLAGLLTKIENPITSEVKSTQSVGQNTGMEDLGLNHLVPVRMCFASLPAGKMEFQSFKSKTFLPKLSPRTGLDCVSSHERVKTPELKETLSFHGQIVDRELWGIASALNFFSLEWQSFKYISDEASHLTQNDCFVIRTEVAERAGEEFFSHFNKRLYQDEQLEMMSTKTPHRALINNEKSGLDLAFLDKLSDNPLFYFTQTQKIQLTKLMKQMAHHEPSEQEKFVQFFEKLSAMKNLNAKERTRALLESASETIAPWKKHLRLRLEDLQKHLPKFAKLNSVDIEQDLFKVELLFNSHEDLEQQLQKLLTVNFSSLFSYYQIKTETNSSTAKGQELK